ncbi:MAG: dolichyl-phosphate beta-glucosyltransferase [Methanothrix sp.]
MCLLTIIIPAFNEAARIEGTLRGYAEHFGGHYRDIEILVITDGCKDATPKIVDELSQEFPCIRRIHPPHRLGKGGAVVEGIKAASGDVIGFLDADGSIPPKDACQLFEKLDGCDGVIASRWVDGAEVKRHEPACRIIASRCFNMLVRILFQLPFKDTQCGGKFFRNSAISSIIPGLKVNGWAFDVEVLYRLAGMGYTVKEVPITWEHKDGSQLDLPHTSINMLISIIGLKLRSSFVPRSKHNENIHRYREETKDASGIIKEIQ